MDLRRRLIAQPCSGSSASIFRRSRSRVPWTRSLGLLILVSMMSILVLISVSKGSTQTGAHRAGRGGVGTEMPEDRFRSRDKLRFGRQHFRREAGLDVEPLPVDPDDKPADDRFLFL